MWPARTVVNVRSITNIASPLIGHVVKLQDLGLEVSNRYIRTMLGKRLNTSQVSEKNLDDKTKLFLQETDLVGSLLTLRHRQK